MGKFIDLTGQRFGRLTVSGRGENGKNGRVRWNCTCECGGQITTVGYTLQNGKTTSCGCYFLEVVTNHRMKHGYARNKPTEYVIWSGMNNRCANVKNKKYKDYGARGITVCDRWKNSFQNFLDDMGTRPSLNHSIDRIDVNGNYEPSNCRWATASEQTVNQRIRITNTSGVPGVIWHKNSGKWTPCITINRKRIHLGTFENFDDAVIARKEAELKYWGKSS